MEMQASPLSFYTQPFAHLSDEAIQNFQSLVERATTDPDLRQRLLDDPKGTLIAEFGADNVNPKATFNVVDGDAADVTLILPKAIDASGELSDEDLEAVAGGESCTSFSDWTSFGCIYPTDPGDS